MSDTTRTAPPAVYAAISAVMADVGIDGIGKHRKSVGGATYQFRGIDDVYNVLSGLLCKHKLMILPRMISSTHEERISAAGKPVYWTYVTAEFDLVCAVDGSVHTCRTFGEALDSSDKSTNKAMSAAFKYVAMQAFCIPTEGDNDADATTHEVAPRAREAAQSAPTVSPAQATIAITAAFNGAFDKPELDAVWKRTAVERARIAKAEPGLRANLVAVFKKKAEGFIAAAAPILDDDCPF